MDSRFRGNDTSPTLAESQQEFFSAVSPDSQNRSPAGRLSIYAGGYYARLFESLCEVYPAVRHVLGDKILSRWTHEYAGRYPSKEYNLNVIGKYFPEFLKNPEITKEMPFLADLAQLEWQISSAFHTASQTPLEPSAFADISPGDWEKAVLHFQPSVSVLHSDWPVLDIWSVRNEPVENIKLDTVNRPQDVFIFRRGLEVQCALLDRAQFRMLEGLLSGRTLGEMSGTLTDEFEGDPGEISNWFSSWIALGLITQCTVIPA